MSLSRRLSPITSRLAHILTARRTARTLAARPGAETATLGIFYAGPVGDIYQVTQWLSVFERLNGQHPAILLVKDSRAAAALAQMTSLPIRIAGHADAIEPLVPNLGLKALFYVNNNLANFSALRLSNVTHVHLSHGESEKVSMISNQLKAYDYCFVAGQAAVDRILSALPRFEPSHLAKVGRPQLDELFTAIPLEPVPNRHTVLYAPTWEGDRKAMAYSSITVHGERWVGDVLKDSTLRLIYRPHPKTGTRDVNTRKADQRIRKMIESAAKSNPDAGHLVDVQPDYNPALVSADVSFFDVSAMSLDFQVLQRPMFAYDGEHGSRTIPELPNSLANRVADALEDDVRPLIHALLTKEASANDTENVHRYFGDTTPGTSLKTFEATIQDLLVS